MKINANTLLATAREFHNQVLKADLKLIKSKSFDLWANIVANKNYSALKSQLNNPNCEPIEFEFNISKISTLFKDKQKDLEHEKLTEIFANSIRKNIEEIDPLFHYLADLIEDTKSRTIVFFYGGDIGLMEVGKPGYYKLAEHRIKDFDHAKDIERLVQSIAGQGLNEHYQIWASSTATASKEAVKNFHIILKDKKDSFSSELAKELESNSIDFEDYSETYDKVHDFLHEYFVAQPSSFFDINLTVVEDFIESLVGALCNQMPFFDPNEYEDEPTTLKDRLYEVIEHKASLHSRLAA